MFYYEVAPTKIVRAGADVFTYASEAELSIGQIVTVEAGKKQFVGVVMRAVQKPEYTTKPIISVVESLPLPIPLVELAQWLGTYYLTPLALVFQTLLPTGLTKNRRDSSAQSAKSARRDRTKI